MKNAVKITVKREAETRWSAKAEAFKPISEGFTELVEFLESLLDDISQTMDTRNEAGTLLQNILIFNFIFLLHFWNNILGKVDRVQKRLQDPTMNFKNAASDMKMLENFFKEFRDHLCQNSIEYSKGRCMEWGIEVERRVRRQRIMPGERAGDSGLSAEDEVSRVLKMILDCFQQELTTRFRRLNDLNKKFEFLLDVRILLKKNGDENQESLQQRCLDLGNFYSTDISGAELFTEIVDCQMLLESRGGPIPTTPLDLLSFILSYGDDVFPNLRIALQILLIIAVSIAGCERSFSKLKLILSYLRASMGQQRLVDLAILSIERETLE